MAAVYIGNSVSKKGNIYCRFKTNIGSVISVQEKYIECELVKGIEYMVGVYPRVYNNEPFFAFSVHNMPVDEDTGIEVAANE